ncbi:MAG: hypothetical protein MUE51_03950 [Thermoleophilia bacterium]|jgi:hypothetical protein|nr:hypothetical protein [Thermoleophilia bacterium]
MTRTAALRRTLVGALLLPAALAGAAAPAAAAESSFRTVDVTIPAKRQIPLPTAQCPVATPYLLDGTGLSGHGYSLVGVDGVTVFGTPGRFMMEDAGAGVRAVTGIGGGSVVNGGDTARTVYVQLACTDDLGRALAARS